MSSVFSPNKIQISASMNVKIGQDNFNYRMYIEQNIKMENFATFEEVVKAAAEQFGVPSNLLGEYENALIIYLESEARRPAIGLGSLSLGNGWVDPEIETFTRKLTNIAVFLPTTEDYWNIPSENPEIESRKSSALEKLAKTRLERAKAMTGTEKE